VASEAADSALIANNEPGQSLSVRDG